ncbi:sporulation membrane protein YtaF [Aciduricibacillus chroicocephali]|uniref:Sporulation membrane protein YtaF n=1 Tax=Aciduricibacillus chroicocephali TaxID=3054939 RepID=A0ABY9KTP1_9BACI|nr:sporulation membrane protein YtaF [Bacillaceae bacterium 44XB]
MLYYTGLLFLIIAVSLDGFGVGITYGMQKIRLPLLPLLIIMCCSGTVVLVSMTIGTWLTTWIKPEITEKLGGLILIAIGLFSLTNLLRQSKRSSNPKSQSESPKRSDFITVMGTPDRADLDKSGSISAKESLLLGIALALDAFGAGLGAAIIGYTPLLTAVLIALMSGTLLFLGMKTGLFLLRSDRLARMGFLPPLLLMALGAFNLLSK